MITLAFNDMYDRHKNHLSGLIGYIKLEMTTDKDAGKPKYTLEALPTLHEPADGVATTVVYRGDQALQLVQTFMTASERFDAPACFFGMKVDRKVITGFSSTALLLMTPQLLTIVQDL